MYQAVVLLEGELTDNDTARLTDAHRPLAPVRYHLIMSVHAHDVLESALATFGVQSGDLYGADTVHDRAVDDERRAADAQAQSVLDRSRRRLVVAGNSADIVLVHGNPIDACIHLVASVKADEVVVMFRSRQPKQSEELDRTAGRRFGVRAVRYLTHA